MTATVDYSWFWHFASRCESEACLRPLCHWKPQQKSNLQIPKFAKALFFKETQVVIAQMGAQRHDPLFVWVRFWYLPALTRQTRANSCATKCRDFFAALVQCSDFPTALQFKVTVLQLCAQNELAMVPCFTRGMIGFCLGRSGPPRGSSGRTRPRI